MWVSFDRYSGNGDVSETGEEYEVAVRYMSSTLPQLSQVEGPKKPAWNGFNTFAGEFGNDPDSACFLFDPGQSGLASGGFINLAAADSFQIAIQEQLRCARFHVTNCGQVHGAYIDNIRIRFVRNQPFTGVDPGAPTLDFVRGAYPNPSRDGSATVKYSLSRSVPVTIRFYDLRGALVHEALLTGKPGENQYRWDGTTRAGTAATSGIYFYRLYADGVEFRNNLQRVVFVGVSGR
jgi:hypothetical protein